MRLACRRLLLPTLTLAVVVLTPLRASAIPITVVGDSTGTLSTATGNLTFNDATNTLTLTLTNTSPFDARITAIGFDVFAGNANGFSGSTTPASGFIFSDADLGTVPQFNSAELDFGFITGNSGNFNGGSPNDGLAPGGTLTFTVTGAAFGNGLTEAQLAEDLFVRFQRVGADGEGSDVGTVRVPDASSSLSLLGLAMGALAAFRRRTRLPR